jgi:hypothetical protein
MIFGICEQRKFNKRQLELYELSTAPQVFVKLDSLTLSQGHNVFYKVKNVGNSPALDVRLACRITQNKKHPLVEERTGTVKGEIFPSDWADGRSKQDFQPKGTWYLHFRVDMHDFLRKKYFYKSTYYIIFDSVNTTKGTIEYRGGMEYSEYGELDR